MTIKLTDAQFEAAMKKVGVYKRELDDLKIAAKLVIQHGQHPRKNPGDDVSIPKWALEKLIGVVSTKQEQL